MYVFFDMECTKDFEKHDGSFEHIPKLIRAQQMCSKGEAVDALSVDCKQCGKRTHVVWTEHPLGIFIDYLQQSRPFADEIYVVSHNSRGYDVQFLLRTFLEMRWTPQLIMDGTKILSMIVENLHFLILLIVYLSLKSMPKSCDLTCTSLTRPAIWTIWALIPNPNSMGQDRG